VVILNNAYLSLIRQNQKYAYEYECAVAMEENQNGLIDYVKVAEGFGCKAERVTEPQDIAAALQRAKASDMPYVIDIVCEKETDGSMGNSIDAVKEHE
jgi:tartronate-semialdehyde synthase